MRALFTVLFLVFWLTGCHRTHYYYVATAPTDLFQLPSDQSPVMANVQAQDTLSTRKRIGLVDNRFIKVVHRSNSGYVRSTGHEFLYSTRCTTGYGSWVSNLRFNPELSFQFHSRQTKSKNNETERTYRSSRPTAGASRSSSQSYRSSTYRSSASLGPR